MSTQTLRNNAARFGQGNSLFNLIKLRDWNDIELEVIQVRATEPVRIQEKIEENENNEEKIMEKINTS